MNNIDIKFKEISSENAATLLMQTFPADAPNCHEAFDVIAHRSWKRADQIRLARFYLAKMPFAKSKPYEILASFMSLPILISLVREALPVQPRDRQLVAYHLIPVLRKKIRTDRDRDLVTQFVSETRGSFEIFTE